MKQDQNHTKYNGLEELYAIEKFLPRYNEKIIKIFCKSIKDNKFKKIIDFGAGIGTLSKIIQNKTGIIPVCIEIDKTNKNILAERGFKHFNSLSEINDEVEIIFSSNVLEHIENDIKVLKEIFKKLKNNGKIFLYLPANNFLWTNLDEKVGHFRRYDRNELVKKLKSCGFKIEKCHYSDSIGFFATLLTKFFSRNNPILSQNTLIFYDNFVLPFSNFFDNIGFNKILGKNLIVYARKIK